MYFSEDDNQEGYGTIDKGKRQLNGQKLENT